MTSPNKEGELLAKHRSTTYQREALATLKKRGFKPLGYSGNGYLVVRHEPSGFQTELPSTPSDKRVTKNLDATIERGIKWMEKAGPQFEQWMYEKYELQPEETKRLELRLSEEIRKFFTEKNVHGASRNSVSVWIRNNPGWRNLNPDQRGRGTRTWEVTRPASNFELVEEVDPEEFWEPEPDDGKTLIVESLSPEAEVSETASEKAVRLSQEDPNQPDEAPASPNGRVTESPLDPDMIHRLTEALAGPQLAEQQSRIQLARSELEALDGNLSAQIEEVTKARDVIRDLISILEG